ncbi:AzlC family ABC transporter permease [Endozoicomonas sp. Mp262]|uniref:AzlC family ABC transporter permease n=1 Tax=Endozoicomonas sp. Mp262 TaxID=2919499 RepID=UPI0021D87FB2
MLPENKKNPIWLQAAMDIMPLSLACIPWGILTGSLAIETGLSPFQAMCMSLLVFAGAAQIAGLNMLQLASPLLSILGTTFVVSSRHILYSAVFRDFARQLPRHKRYLLAFLLSDEMFAIAEAYRQKHGCFHFRYAMSAGLGFYIVWNLSTLTGILLGTALDDMASLGFEFAVAAVFIAIVIPSIKNLPSLVAVLVSGLIIIISELCGLTNGILLAGLGGMLCAYSLDQLRSKLR